MENSTLKDQDQKIQETCNEIASLSGQEVEEVWKHILDVGKIMDFVDIHDSLALIHEGTKTMVRSYGLGYSFELKKAKALAEERGVGLLDVLPEFPKLKPLLP